MLCFSLVFLTFLISSLILIIPSALPILLILSVWAFPSFWNSGATLFVFSPCATIIAVMISVASIRMSPVTPLLSSVSMVSKPSRMSSPSSTIVSTSFSSIQLQRDSMMYLLSSGQLCANVIFSNTILYSVSFHLFSSPPVISSKLIFSS